MGFLHFLKNLGHSIEHAAEDVAHGIEHVAKDALHAAEATAEMCGDALQGNFSKALNDAVKASTALAKGMTDMQKAYTDAAADAVTDLHISKGLDKMAQHVKNFEHKVVDDVVKTATQVSQGVANDVAGTVNGIVNVAKDVAHGNLGKALSDGMSAAGSAVSLASDLTPEGLAANAAVSAMQVAHIGNSTFQNVVGGLVGGPKGFVKRAAETGASLATSTVVNQVASAAGSNGNNVLLAASMAPIAADMFGEMRSKRGPHTSTEGLEHAAAGSVPPKKTTEIPAKEKPEADLKTQPSPLFWPDILGVSQDASKKEINQAYRKLSLLNHPDKGGDVEKQKVINNARDAAVVSLEQRVAADTMMAA
jgi:hypothetical protein